MVPRGLYRQVNREKRRIPLNTIAKNGTAGMFVWNTIGSICSAGTSFILLIFVTRICGSSDAGIFALGFANAQLMLTIGRFGMRAFQVTDVKSDIKFSTYFLSRLITCLAMLLVSAGYIIFSGYSFEKSAVVFGLCIIKMTDALEDVYHGLFQQNGRMAAAGRLLTIRNVITILSFGLILAATGNLLAACLATAAISIAACLLLNIPVARTMVRLRTASSRNELMVLFRSCLPLFIGSFLSIYIYNVPKYMIDRLLTSDMQTYYNILFMPTFVINLLGEFLFKPLLTGLAVRWEQNQLRIFANYVLRLFSGIVLITFAAVGAGSLVGCEILSFIYGVDLLRYRTELVLLLFAGGFAACVYLLFHILTAMRRQVSLLYGYTVSALITTVLAPLLIKKMAMMGAALTCLVSSMLLFAVFSLILLYGILRKGKSVS